MTGYTSTNTQINIVSTKFLLYLQLWDFTHSSFQFILRNLILKGKIKLRTLKSRNLMPFFIFAYCNRGNKTPRNTVSQKSRNLTDFLKTNLSAIWVKKRQKSGFLHPTISKITLAKEKRKRKSEEEEGRRREKKKIGGHLGDGGVFGQKISCLTEEVDLAVTFSKIRLEIKRNFVITSNK